MSLMLRLEWVDGDEKAICMFDMRYEVGRIERYM